MIYLEYPCGCLIEKDKAPYTNEKVDGARKTGYYCHVHDCKATHKVGYCRECKKEIRAVMPSRNLPKRCEEHKKSTLLKQMRKSAKVYRDNERKKPLIKNIVFKQPVRALSVADAKGKGIPCIPGPQGIKLFYVHSRLDNYKKGVA